MISKVSYSVNNNYGIIKYCANDNFFDSPLGLTTCLGEIQQRKVNSHCNDR